MQHKTLTRMIWIFACVAPTFGQIQTTTNQNSWYNYFGDHGLRGKWGVHVETQFRRNGTISRSQQLLLRPGISYQLNPAIALTLGYAWIKTHRYGEHPVRFAFPEHRTYQQLILTQRAGKLPLQHRYRMEQRFLGDRTPGFTGPGTNTWRYQNRFRYLVRTDIPLLHDAQERSRVYLGLYDEFMINIAPNVGASLFDQNRAYAAIGYRTQKSVRFEVGYMNQMLQQRNGRILERNHTLQASVISNAGINEIVGSVGRLRSTAGRRQPGR